MYLCGGARVCVCLFSAGRSSPTSTRPQPSFRIARTPVGCVFERGEREGEIERVSDILVSQCVVDSIKNARAFVCVYVCVMPVLFRKPVADLHRPLLAVCALVHSHGLELHALCWMCVWV